MIRCIRIVGRMQRVIFQFQREGQTEGSVTQGGGGGGGHKLKIRKQNAGVFRAT